jgi:glycosyltransferase involved in cell wall biosynthesis
MPMKTLHLTNSWHESSGGIATFYRALIAEANQRGHLIRLIVPGQKDQIEEFGEFGRIYHVQAPPALLSPGYRLIYPTQFLSAGSKLQAILRAERPDVIEICDKYTLNYLGALLRMRLLGSVDFRPVVTGLSCERMDDNFRSYVGKLPLAKAFCSFYMRWAYFPFFDHHIANSEYTAAELRTASEGHLVQRGVWVKHMGVDLCHLSPARRSSALRRRLLQNFGASEESVLLLYVGRLVPEKNLSLLFELLAHLTQHSQRDFRLLVVGDGMERKRWEIETAWWVPGRALFLGHISDRNVLADIYANADVFVHPNPREPFGIAPLEAMASGLPLIAPNSGGVTSYARVGNAWTVAPTTTGFCAAIEQVLSDETLRNAKISAALATVGEYAWNRVASSFLDLYAELHRASQEPAGGDLAPAFSSTPAAGARSFLLQSVSRSAERTFRFVSKLWFETASRESESLEPESRGQIGRKSMRPVN